MTYLIRVASYGQKNPVPVPETAHLTPEQRAEYTFIMTLDNEDQYLIPEMDAWRISILTRHMAIGHVFQILK